jgi:hypothetical protein
MIRGTRILAVLSVCALSGAASLFGQAAPPPVKVNPPAAAKSRAGAPAPSSAGKGTSIGKGKTSVSTANAAGDTDSVWAEKIDIDGDGNVDDTNALWDDEDKVLYYSKDGTFTCGDGGTGSGGMLVAVYAAGNAYGKPANSGWWVTDLDKGECGARAAALMGCRFDGSGAYSACGLAVIDAKTDDITITTVSK